MEDQRIKTVLDVAAALGCVDRPRSGAVGAAGFMENSAIKDKNTGFLLLLADALDIIDKNRNRDKSIAFLADLAAQLGLTSDGIDVPDMIENKKQFLIDFADELGVIVRDDARAAFKYGPDYTATETDHDLIIDLYKTPDRMDMVRAAVDAIAHCAPLVVAPDNQEADR